MTDSDYWEALRAEAILPGSFASVHPVNRSTCRELANRAPAETPAWARYANAIAIWQAFYRCHRRESRPVLIQP